MVEFSVLRPHFLIAVYVVVVEVYRNTTTKRGINQCHSVVDRQGYRCGRLMNMEIYFPVLVRASECGFARDR